MGAVTNLSSSDGSASFGSQEEGSLAGAQRRNVSRSFLDNFKPVRDEVTVEHLPVHGALPVDLDGLYIRTGPNPQFLPSGRSHWLDGDGMLHAVAIERGTASYRNRYVRTAVWHEEARAGRALSTGLMHAPDLDAVRAGRSAYKNTANTSVIVHHGRALALCESGVPYQIALPSLETVGPYALGHDADQPFTAHPKSDPATGELLYIRYRLGVRPYVIYGILNQHGCVVHETSVETVRPSMMHDFAVSAHYTLVLDLPLYFDIARALRGMSGWVYDRSLSTHFGVLPRYAHGSQMRWFEGPACCVTHVVNLYEDGRELVLIAVRYGEVPPIFTLDPPDENATPPAPEAKRAYLHEWRFNLESGAVHERQLASIPIEFPRINEQYVGRASRYTYLMSDVPQSGVVKYDAHTGQSHLRLHGMGRFGGEVVYVPRLGAHTEDDGYLLTYVWAGVQQQRELLVLDARHFAAEPVARVELPARVPFGLHGTFVPQAQWAREPA